MKISQLIHNKPDLFETLCKNHKVTFLYAFGSSLTEKFNDTSDIDLLVEINEKDPLEKGEKLISLWDELEKFFNRHVDLLTESSLKNTFLRKNIENTKILIYDGRSEKILI
jgi:predicted nucleotidyltransferase